MIEMPIFEIGRIYFLFVPFLHEKFASDTTKVPGTTEHMFWALLWYAQTVYKTLKSIDFNRLYLFVRSILNHSISFNCTGFWNFFQSSIDLFAFFLSFILILLFLFYYFNKHVKWEKESSVYKTEYHYGALLGDSQFVCW